MQKIRDEAGRADAGRGNGVDFISPMDAQIETLVRLQAVDLERSRLAAEAKALPLEVSQAEAALRTAQQRAADATSALGREESLRTKLDKEIAVHQQKAAKFRAQLDVVTTTEQANAIEHEIGFSQQEIARLEEEEFASMERTEAQEKELAAARESVETLAGALEKTQERFKTRMAENRSALAAYEAERLGLREKIDEQYLTRFDRISTSRGTGLAKAERQQCGGCQMGIRPQMWNQLREGELLVCDSCSRLLYWDPAIVAPDASVAPKEPKSSSASKIHGAQAS